MTFQEKRAGRLRIIMFITITALILISVKLYDTNKDRELNKPKSVVVQAQADVEAPSEPVAPEVVSEPTPTPEPVVEVVEQPQEPVRMSGDCSLVNNYTDWDTRIAYAICMAESTGNVMAHNSGDNHGSCVGSYSLMQVGCFWYPFYGYSSADYYNPQVNIEIAHSIWQRQGGFGAWTTYTGGKYTKYL